MASSMFNISSYSRFNLSESESDINVFIKEFGYRITKQFAREERNIQSTFPSFAENNLSDHDMTWQIENEEKYIKNTPNKNLVHLYYLSEVGFICSMIYSPDGEFLIVGHPTGLIQVVTININMNEESKIISEYASRIASYYANEEAPRIWYPMFYKGRKDNRNKHTWVKENNKMFLNGTPNKILCNRWFGCELGAISAMTYSSNGLYIVVGHTSGMIQMRHGSTGTVLFTLRNIQFPPKPIYALHYSRLEERVCFAACADGIVYRIEIPNIPASTENPAEYCIRADPALEYLTTQFYGSPGTLSAASPFVSRQDIFIHVVYHSDTNIKAPLTSLMSIGDEIYYLLHQKNYLLAYFPCMLAESLTRVFQREKERYPALSLGLTADQTKIIVGYADASIKVYDMETQEVDLTYKVHKLRLQFIPKKLQRMHFGQVCALRCHDQAPYMFASGAWDNTLRIWDIRCKVGCMMTFEGVNICGDSIDLNREHCLVGSWQPTEALTVWDITAKKRLNIVRVQNRRPDVDGEYIYACRYWASKQYNRKGKYGIIGGSGTNCVEVINLHNRYIACSYPVAGSIQAITSHEERIAFGGTAPVLNIVSFHDPKHEKYRENSDSSEELKMGVAWEGEPDRGSILIDPDNKPS